MDTIVLYGVGSDTSGYSGALADIHLVIRGVVSGSVVPSVNDVPEPDSLILLGLGIPRLFLRRGRRNARKNHRAPITLTTRGPHDVLLIPAWQAASHSPTIGRCGSIKLCTIAAPKINQEDTVLARWQFWVTTVVALLVALTAGYSMMLFSQNRNAQAELGKRAQYVQQSIQLEGLYREMVKALADLSIRNQDKALTDLLGSQGITVSANSDQPGVPTDAKKGAK